MTKEEKVDTYVTRLYCNKCEIEMEMGDNVFTTFPPQYKYTCPKCGKAEVSTRSYPGIDYKVKEEKL